MSARHTTMFRCTSCRWTGPESELDYYGPHIRCPKCARTAELLTDDLVSKTGDAK